MNRKQSIETFIEDSGLLFEEMGATRMAGRIYGYMLVADSETVSFNELTDAMQASKSSISSNVRTLIRIGYIRITTLPGDRKTYYALNHDVNLAEIMSSRLKLIKGIIDQNATAMELRKDKTDKPSVWLRKTTDFYQWVLDEMPGFLKQYTAKDNRQ
jgi:DNA-binding transcriptional regulator GbsR (MarR family)